MNLRTVHALLFLALLLAAPAGAQQVLYSKFEKFDFRTGEFSVVGKVGGKLYVYRGASDGFFLDAYDAQMQRTATVILDFVPRRAFGTKFITYADRLMILYQVTESSKVIQYATVLDGNGRLLRGPVEIDNVKPAFLGGRSGLYGYSVSPNKQRIAIYGVNTKDKQLTARVVWIDTALNKLATTEAGFTADNEIQFGEATVNDDGGFYLPAYTPYGSRQYADRIWLLATEMGGKSLQPAEVPLNGLYAAGTYMELAQSGGRIYVGGFYSDKKNGNYEGIIYAYYDVAERIFRDFKTIRFSDKLRMAAGERNTKRAFNDYQVRQLIVRNDGGFVMISESFFVNTRNSYNQGFGYYSYYYPSVGASVREYNYEDILAISCNGDGTPEWSEFIRKQQYSQEDGGLFSSYALINTGGMLGFMFNDFNPTRSRIQLATLDNNGKVDINAVQGKSTEDPDWLPKSGKQVSAKEFVVPCLKRNQISFAKVTF